MLRYWANLPGMFGPRGAALQRADMEYECAACDARSIAEQLHELTGVAPKVVDVKRTFANSFALGKRREVLIYPVEKNEP